MDFLSALRERMVLADGAMGTFLFSKGVPREACLEELNLSSPSLVRQVHAEYRAAGAEVLQANTFGANAVRLGYTSDQLSVLKQNLVAANSQIKDVDIAEESTNYAKFNILVQAGTAMLAQANIVPQSTLKLLS